MSGKGNGRAGPAISQGGSGLPSRIILHGVEGIGKTSAGANALKPVFSMTRQETGLLTLIDNGIVGPTDHFDECFSWTELTGNVRDLIEHDTGHRTYVLDTLNGAERLCFEHVCREKFNDDWKGFLAYGRGPEESQQEWIHFLALLDQLRQERKMAVLLLCHTRVKTFKNPEGEDYDRYTPDMNDKTWGLSHKWADVVLFGNFLTVAKKDRGALKAKGQGGEQRFFWTTRNAAYDAKNRVGLPSMIPMGRDGREAWGSLRNAMVQARQRGQTPTPATRQPEGDKVADQQGQTAAAATATAGGGES